MQVPVSKVLKKDLEKKSKTMGFSSVNELVRVVLQSFVVNDTILKFMPKEEVPMVDEEMEARIAQSLMDYKKGNFTVIDSSKPNAIKNWLKNL